MSIIASVKAIIFSYFLGGMAASDEAKEQVPAARVRDQSSEGSIFGQP